MSAPNDWNVGEGTRVAVDGDKAQGHLCGEEVIGKGHRLDAESVEAVKEAKRLFQFGRTRGLEHIRDERDAPLEAARLPRSPPNSTADTF